MVQSHLRKRSRRKAYRFFGDRLPVQYKTRFEDGEAVLRDISTSGCALSSVTVPVLLQEKVLIILVLPGENEKIEATGRVTRAEADSFAVSFTLIELASVKLIQMFFFQARTGKDPGTHFHQGYSSSPAGRSNQKKYHH